MGRRTLQLRLATTFACGLAALCLTVGAAAAGPNSSDCLTCHAEMEPKVAADALAGSAHQALACRDCHADITEVPHGKPKPVDCGICHAKESTAWAKGPHASRGGPTCTDCHGTHRIPAPGSAGSLASNERQIQVCGGCHARLAGGDKWIKAFANSVHGRGITQRGLNVAPACATCHGAHDVKPLKTDHNAGAKQAVAELCGTCHKPVYEAFEKSIHAAALAKGIGSAPTCTDCHGEHNIQASTDKASSVAPASVPATCGHCHADKRLMANFGLPADRVSTFLKSYHGVALEMGDLRAADCASCHGAHDILPSSDPASRTNPANLQKTCGKCHPGAGKNFSNVKFHESVSPRGARGAWFVRVFYIFFITILVGAFVLHIGVRLIGLIRRRSGGNGAGNDGGEGHER